MILQILARESAEHTEVENEGFF